MRQAALGAHGAVADGSEDAFDWIGRPDMPPVLRPGSRRRPARRRGPLSSRRRLGGIWRRTLAAKVFTALSASARPSAIQISCRAALAAVCRDFGSLFKTLAVLWTQQRWRRVSGKISSSAFQKPRAPSPMASSGPIVSPRPRRHASNSRQLWALSRTPAWKPTSSLRPSGVAPMRTRMHCFSSSSRPWR